MPKDLEKEFTKLLTEAAEYLSLVPAAIGEEELRGLLADSVHNITECTRLIDAIIEESKNQE